MALLHHLGRQRRHADIRLATGTGRPGPHDLVPDDPEPEHARSDRSSRNRSHPWPGRSVDRSSRPVPTVRSPSPGSGPRAGAAPGAWARSASEAGARPGWRRAGPGPEKARGGFAPWKAGCRSAARTMGRRSVRRVRPVPRQKVSTGRHFVETIFMFYLTSIPALPGARPGGPALFQTPGATPQTTAVPEEDLEPVAVAVGEDKPVARERVLLQDGAVGPDQPGGPTRGQGRELELGERRDRRDHGISSDPALERRKPQPMAPGKLPLRQARLGKPPGPPRHLSPTGSTAAWQYG